MTTFIEQGIDGLELNHGAAERLEIKVQGGAGGMKYMHKIDPMLNLVFYQVLFQHLQQSAVAQYPVQTVLAFLKQNKYPDTFQESGMDGDFLLEADGTVLKELGVHELSIGSQRDQDQIQAKSRQ